MKIEQHNIIYFMASPFPLSVTQVAKNINYIFQKISNLLLGYKKLYSFGTFD